MNLESFPLSSIVLLPLIGAFETFLSSKEGEDNTLPGISH